MLRSVCSVTAVILSTLVAASVTPAAAQNLSIVNYQYVSEQTVTLTQSNITYRADLVNTGNPLAAVSATLTSLNSSSFTVVAGHDTLNFAPVPANSQSTSNNTFTILVDRTVKFDFSNIQWAIRATPLAPVANAGPNQTAQVAATVTLNGSGSTNPSGMGALTYSWAFTMRPVGSQATLTNPTSVMPTFVVDLAGNYAITLTVGNGVATASATVLVSTLNSPPVAVAGQNQTVAAGATVVLNCGASSDVDGDPLTYKWSLTSVPAGSTAQLTRVNTVSVTFVADKLGAYTAQCIVNDGKTDSQPSIVTITTVNTKPVANAGSGQAVNVNTLVQLNGAGSTDVDGDPLTYRWSLVSLPSGSHATLSNPASVNPTFTVDQPGTYVAQLIVNDGVQDSNPATVTITTNALLPPTANAGPGQTVVHNKLVTLNGSGKDPQGLPLTFQWSMVSKPTVGSAGSDSAASLSSAATGNPTFFADKVGQYVVQLIVSNGFLSSAPSTVMINTTNTAPVANAGPTQNVAVGANVTLDGSGSSDADNDPLTYKWSILSRPSGSTTTLTAASSVMPMFFADAPGTYVVQLIVNDGYTDSNPSTVMITASSSTAITLTPNPLNMSTAAPGILTVTLPFVAGASGQMVNLQSSNPGVATVPAGVTVPPNSTGVNVSVTPVSVGGTSIVATSSGVQPGNATVNVSAAQITLTTDAPIIGLTRTINGTITLSGPAPTGGVTITLSASPGGIVDVEPPSVLIAGGSMTGTFTVQGLANGPATITGSSTGYSSGAVNVSVGLVGAIILQSGVTVAPGQSATLAVNLVTPAPVGGVTIALVSSDPTTVTVTPSVFIAAKATTPATQPTVNGVQFGSATIGASAGGFVGDSKQVTVGATLSFPPGPIQINGTITQNVVLTLSSAAPAAGLTVNLNSSNGGVATVPATVFIQPNTTTVNVPVTGVTAGPATITASAPSVGGATVGVNVAVFGQIILSNGTVGIGQTVAFPVTLPSPAPAGGVTITLASSDTTIATITPSVFIAFNSTTPATQPQVTGVSVGPASITASGPPYQTATKSVQVGAALSFSPQSLTVTGISTQNLTLNLSAAQPNPLTVNLTSSNTGAATVPGTVTILANTTSVTVPVTGVAPGMSTITASATGVSTATASVTDIPVPTLNFTPPSLTVTAGDTQNLTLTLSAAQSSALTVNLSSSNMGAATVPGTVTIPANTTVFPVPVTGVTSGSSTITASAAGFANATASVTVNPVLNLSFTPQNLTITGPATQNLTLNLSPAQATAVTVNLMSSNTGIATVPGTITIPANTTSAPVPVTGVAIGSATITASMTLSGMAVGSSKVTGSSAPTAASATANVTVVTGGTIGVPSNTVILAPGQSVPFPVGLPAPAPGPGPVTITLQSNDTSKVIVTQSVVIPAGATAPSTQPVVTGVNFGSATITASAGAYTAGSQVVQVAAVLSFSPNTLTLGSGANGNLTLTLSAPAPVGGLMVNLSSDTPGVATVPLNVTFPVNATSVSVAVTAVAAGSATITASTLAPNVTAATAKVTVVNGLVLPSNLTVAPGLSVPFPVTVGSAQATDTFVTLTSSDATIVALTGTGTGTTSFIIPAGQTAPNRTPNVFGVNLGSATVTATAFGFDTVTTTVKVGTTLGFFPTALTVTPGSKQNITLSLLEPLPTAVTINLSSDNTAVATVPSSATFGAGVTSVTFQVTGVSAGATVIHASNLALNIPDTTASVSVGNGVLTITTTSPLANGQVGVPYSQTLMTLGGTLPLTWLQTGGVMPNGLTLNASTGQITGTPTAPVTNASLTFQVTDSGVPTPQTATATFLLTIAMGTPLSITTSSLQAGTLNTAYTAQVNATGGTQPYTFSATGLPVGLTIDQSSGVISGTPTTAGSSTVTVTVTDSTSPTHQMATANLTLLITAGPLMFTSQSLADGQVGVPYSQTLTVTGGTPPYSFGLTTGRLPSGLTLDSSTGIISGTPTATATGSSLTFTVTDTTTPTAQTAMGSFTLTIGASGGPLKFTSLSLPAGQVNMPYSQMLTALGGTAPYTFGILDGSLPTGLTLNASTGLISGIPTVAMAPRLGFIVTDSTTPIAQTATTSFIITIASGPPQITTTSLPSGVVNSAYSATVSATGGTTPYTFTATGLPAGLTISGAGQITGTPTTAGTSTAVVTVTDSTSPTHLIATANLSITIVPPVSITTTSLPGGTVNVAYAATTVMATGGTAPYTFTATGLPAGLTISASGQITGTPTVLGTSTAVVTVTDSTSPTHLTATANLSINIGNGVTITTTSLPGGVVNVAYTATTVMATGGTAPYTFTATGLPAGLTISTAGVISGTPTTAGTSTAVVTVTDSTSPTHLTATANLSITIVPPVSITTTSPLPGGVVNVAYTATTVMATGGTAPYTFTATGLPAGLTISTAGVISGTPTAAGTSTAVVTVTDSTSSHLTATANLSITIAPPVSITTTSLPNGVLNVAYTATTVMATGGTAPYTFTATGLPAGLTISTAGVISGTPTAAGPSTAVVTVTDSTSPTHQTATANLPITIGTTVAITTASPLPSGVVNSAYNATVNAAGGTMPYTFSATGLPAGLSISAAGVITGTPTTAGTSTAVVTVTDSSSPHQTAPANLSITIVPPVSITTTSPLPGGTVNVAYTATTVMATGGTTPYTFTATGLPAGLTISAGGVVSGTPTTAGTSTAVVTVTDSTSPTHLTATANLSITIAPPVSITTTSPLPGGTVNVAYTATTVMATGGTTPYTFTATGLPAGLTISAGGVVSGTPTTAGTSTAVVTVTDSTSPTHLTATANLSITIVPPVSITTTSPLPGGVVNVAYTATTVMATGGTAPYTFTATGLPAGLTISTAGVISGTPTTAGTSTAVVTVTDSTSPTHLTATANLSIAIAPPISITTTSPLPGGVANVAYTNTTVMATGGTTPYTFTATGLPAGLTISAAGVISGTPTTAGTGTAVVTVTDSSSPHQTATANLSITIVPPVSITTTSPLPGGTVNLAYTATTVTATGGTTPYTFSATGLPAGLSISAAGVISGTPTTAGTSTAAITVTDSTNPTHLTATANLMITIAPAVIVTPITVGQATIGQNLQAIVSISIPTPPAAGSGGLQVTLTTSDPTLLLLNGMAGPKQTIMVTIPEGVNTIGVAAEALGIGTPTISASASNYAGMGTITVTPSGFVLTSPGGQTFTTNQGSNVSLTVSPVQLDSSGNVGQSQPLRIGATATVNLTSTSTAVGTVTPSVTFNGGDTSQNAVFTAAVTGSQTQASTTINASVPAGFSPPAGGANAVAAFVNGLGCTLPSNLIVGRNLETTFHVTLSSAAQSPLSVIVSSMDSTKLLLSATPNGVGAGTLTLTVPTGASRTPDAYVYGEGAPGTVSFTANCGSAFGTDTKIVTLAKSGFVIAGDGGLGAPLVTGVGPAADVFVYSMYLDPNTNNPVDFQNVNGSIPSPISVNLTETDTPPASNVGTVTPSVTFVGGQGTATASFQGKNQGQATLAVVQPTTPVAFSTPAQDTTIQAQVFGSTLSVCDNVQVGFKLEVSCAVSLSQAAVTPVTVTLTTGSNQLLLSSDPTVAGTNNLVLTVPAGSTSATYYLQGFANSGSATYNGSASGFSAAKGTVFFTPSGFLLLGPNDGTSFSTSLAGGSVSLNLFVAQLDSTGTFQAIGVLAGGQSVTPTLSDDNQNVGTISSVTITGGNQEVNPLFSPSGGGTTTINMGTPAGFTMSGFQAVTATVTTP